jgi:hypothetical protein
MIELFKMGLPYNISFKIKILQQKVQIHFVQNSNAPFELFSYIYIAAAKNQPAFNFKIKLLQ